jgi:hypothetical protein
MPVRADDPVVVDADRDGLGVAKPPRRRVAPGAGVVIVEARYGIEPEQPPQIGALSIHGTAKALFERGFDSASEAKLLKAVNQSLINRTGIAGHGALDWAQECARNGEHKYEPRVEVGQFHKKILLVDF